MRQYIIQLVFFFGLVGFYPPIAAQIEINVVPEYRAIHYAKTLVLAPGQVASADLHLNDFEDSYQLLHSTIRGGVSIAVIDGRDRISNNPNPIPLLSRQLIRTGVIQLGRPPSRDGAIVVFVNKGSTPAEFVVRIDRLGVRPKAMRDQIRRFVELPFRSLGKVYELPLLTVTVRPCGQINAFSSPNITICTELIADLMDKDTPKALFPILFHELGHSLLYIWKQPGYDDETLVDEFGAVLLAKSSPDAVEDLITWFNLGDSVSEAAAQLSVSKKHPLSSERAKYLRQIMQSPDESFRKWSQLLGPHMRRQAP